MGGGVAGAIAWGVGPLCVTVVEDGRRVLEEVRIVDLGEWDGGEC